MPRCPVAVKGVSLLLLCLYLCVLGAVIDDEKEKNFIREQKKRSEK